MFEVSGTSFSPLFDLTFPLNFFKSIVLLSKGEEKESAEKDKGRRTGPQGRPFLLRRGTGTNPAVTSGSFKRRSLKLRRGTKDGTKDILDCDCE